ncbi:hypothetical protein F2Q69_00059584 [Brassica cretica]|uniref:Uncharacterized protein n=1 Tax=Brassica cretica TaxID=69181 RepID=A0A8S9RG09_BRACR|nr:hypothetical protein F2Q69_00059584 [Brassica cretica]
MSSSSFFVSLKNIHNLVLPIGTLSTSIESSPSSEGILTVSGGFSEGFGLGLSALRRATSIFGICTRIAFVMVIICPTANRVVSFSYMVDLCVDR